MKKYISVFITFAILLTFTACESGNNKGPEPTDIVLTPYIEDAPVPGDFTQTAEEIVRNIGIGWNLGNTLDAYNSDDPTIRSHWVDYDVMEEVETSWLDGPDNKTTKELIIRVKNAGFNAIRIPVTWYKMAGEAPDYTIREDWFDHVQMIIDWAVEENMYIVLNSHHDEYIQRISNADEIAASEEAVIALWTQIADRFESYNERLIFEGLNEPRRRTNAWNIQGKWDWSGSAVTHEAVNVLNQAFVNAVRATGGNNEKRHLMVTTYAAQTSPAPLNAFKLPEDPIEENGVSKLILSVHTYAPYHWAHNGEGKYDGNSQAQGDLVRVANLAAGLGIPVIVGEFGSVEENNHKQRVKHAYEYVNTATTMRNRGFNPTVMACFWWDNHRDFRLINRTEEIDGYSAEIIQAMMNARKGLPMQ